MSEVERDDKLFSVNVEYMALDRTPTHRAKDEKNGYLRVFNNPIIKAGVDTYFGREIVGYKKIGLDPDVSYRIYRPAEELQKAVATADLIPILDEHDGNFSADNYNKEQVVGAVGSPQWSPPFIRANLNIQRGDAIEQVEAGTKRALSPGYFYQLVQESGVSPDGQAYDFWMQAIVLNHLALVCRGREGPDLMVLDTGEKEMAEDTKQSTPATTANDEEEDKEKKAEDEEKEAKNMDGTGINPPDPATPAGEPRGAMDGDSGAAAARIAALEKEIASLRAKTSPSLAMDTAEMIRKESDARINEFRAQIRQRDAALAVVRDSLGASVANRVQTMALDSGSDVIAEALKCAGIEAPPAGTSYSALEYIVKGIGKTQKMGMTRQATHMAMDAASDPDNALFAEVEKGRKLHVDNRRIF